MRHSNTIAPLSPCGTLACYLPFSKCDSRPNRRWGGGTHGSIAPRAMGKQKGRIDSVVSIQARSEPWITTFALGVKKVSRSCITLLAVLDPIVVRYGLTAPRVRVET